MPDASLFLDLDGPILDVSDRYFRLHTRLLGPRGQGLNRASYWKLRRARRPLSEILRLSRSRLSEERYRARWLEGIESPKLLELDRLQPHARRTLGELRATHPLILVTLRRRTRCLHRQLRDLRLHDLFREILCGTPPSREPWRAKKALLERSRFLRPNSVVVGDTEVDIRAARALGLTSIAVLSGIRDRARLEAEHPDRIVRGLGALLRLLQ